MADILISQIKKMIRTVPDFPKKKIMFKDITPVLQSGPLFKKVIKVFAKRYVSQKIDSVVCIESRGFIFGAALAYELGVGIVLLRKPGKLPWKIHKESFDLEYGSSSLEAHKDALKAGDRVVIVDDLLATGGTAGAAIKLVEKLKGHVVEAAFLIELSFLNGRKKIHPHKVYSLIDFV